MEVQAVIEVRMRHKKEGEGCEGREGRASGETPRSGAVDRLGRMTIDQPSEEGTIHATTAGVREHLTMFSKQLQA